jgi:hypothetical protein
MTAEWNNSEGNHSVVWHDIWQDDLLSNNIGTTSVRASDSSVYLSVPVSLKWEHVPESQSNYTCRKLMFSEVGLIISRAILTRGEKLFDCSFHLLLLKYIYNTSIREFC